MTVQESPAEAVACCRVGGTECGSVGMGPFEGGHHYLYCLHHSLASGQVTGREHSSSHQQKIGLKIYRAWPCPSEQDPVFPSVNLSHQEPSISLLSFSIVLTKCSPLEKGMANHEQYEKSKRYDTERGTPQVSKCPICYWRSVEK